MGTERATATTGRRSGRACLQAAIVLTVCILGAAQSREDGPDERLMAAIGGPLRTEAHRQRDAARHPYEILCFFGLRDDMTVVEIWPGGGYWTEILAPYLRDKGTYITAVGEEKPDFLAKLHGNTAFDRVRTVDLSQPIGALGPDGSADLVVTFRNLHDWMADGNAAAVLATFHAVLKPGGILGIEDHRGRTDIPQDPKAASGYVRQDYAIALIERAGFRHLADSELSSNPKDTRDYPDGVWTLPPTLQRGETDRARYLAIGESDRFVMTFENLPTAPR
jgi:predicted methyltransferase